MSLLLAQGLRSGVIQTFPTHLDFLVTLQWWLHSAELSQIPSQPSSRYTSLSFSLTPGAIIISPELLPGTLSLGCGLSWAGAVPVL